MDHEIRRQYGVLRQAYPPGEPITVLHIGTDQTALATGTGEKADAVMLLAIGSRRTATDFFKHAPPLPNELETAIMVVEDEVTRARKMVAGHAMLLTADADIRDIARIARVSAGDDDGMVVTNLPALPIEAVERVFDLLVAVSLGRPASSAGIPLHPEFAATLLILRELMHHLQFASVRILAL
jgi:exopolyphosphatase/pppGpp-phosphohydrolase